MQFLLCELDDKNRVFRRQSHEGDEADLEIDIVFQAPQKYTQCGTEKCEWHRHQDCQR